MSRHPALRRKLRHDITRQWPQFLALVVSVLLGISLYAASNNAYQNLDDSYQNVFTQEAFADLFVTSGKIPEFSRTARSTAGVQAVTDRFEADVPFDVSATKFTGRVLSYPSKGTPEVNKLTSLSGAANPGGSGVLLEHHMASDFDLTEGAKLTIVGASGPVEVSVVGIVTSAEFLWPSPSRQEPIALPKTFGVAYATPELAASLAGYTQPNQALVLLTDAARASNGPAILDTLTQDATADGATEVLTQAEQPSNSLLQEDISGFQQMALAFPLLFLSAAGLSMYVLLTRRVQSERPIIGTFRAQGMRGRTLAGHYLSYGVAAGIIGALLGLPLGILGAGSLSEMYVNTIQLPQSLVITQAFRPETIAVGLLFAIAASALAAAAPAILATRIPAAEAMRAEAPDTRGGLSLVERAIPPLQGMPARWRMIVRGISRHKKRSTFTAAGVSMALILILASWLMLDTMNAMLARQFQEVDRSDATATYSVPVTSEQVGQLKNVPEITAAEPTVTQGASLEKSGTTYSTIVYGFEKNTTMHDFYAPDGSQIGLPDDGILVNKSVTYQLSLEPGDSVTMTLPAVGQSRTVRVVAFVDESLGTPVYATNSWLASEFEVLPNSAQMRWDDGSDTAAIQQEVSRLPGVVAFTNTSGVSQLWDQYAGLFYAFIGGMLLLGSVMAFAIIFTMMSVNILERQRELATLSAAGVSHKTIAWLVGGENLIVSALGVIPGLVLGVIASQAMLASYSNDQFTMTVVVQPLTLGIAAVAIMIVAALSLWPGLRALRRVDIAEVVRERAG